MSIASGGECREELIAEVDYTQDEDELDFDQIYNRGGWGYGMNSVEALSMGLCCVTELTLEYEKFIPDHPFINVTSTTLYTELLGLINNPKKLVHFKEKGKSD